MKSFMKSERLTQFSDNLKILEKNCTESKHGFEPSPVVCLYLTECLLVITDIYPTKTLRGMSITTSFNNGQELLNFIDLSIERMKRAEHYALNKEEMDTLEEQITVNAYGFLFDPNFNPIGQLERFLKELLERLTTIHEILTDPRRNKAKLSYVERTFSVTINHTASVLEALSIGATNV